MVVITEKLNHSYSKLSKSNLFSKCSNFGFTDDARKMGHRDAALESLRRFRMRHFSTNSSRLDRRGPPLERRVERPHLGGHHHQDEDDFDAGSNPFSDRNKQKLFCSTQ
jgi:hypothetical protein